MNVEAGIPVPDRDVSHGTDHLTPLIDFDLVVSLAGEIKPPKRGAR